MASKAELQEMAARAARENGIDPTLFMGLVEQESGWNPNAISPTGARGMTQVLRSTARDPGFGVTPLMGDIDDPMENLRFGARYFRSMLNRYDGDVDKALAAYNGGAGNVDKGKYTEEMLNYAPGVQSKAAKYGYEGGGNAAPPSLQSAYTDQEGQVTDAFGSSSGAMGSGGSFYAEQAGLSQGTPDRVSNASHLPEWAGPAIMGFMAGGPIGGLVAGGLSAVMNRGGKDRTDEQNPDAQTGSNRVTDAAAKAQEDMNSLDYRGAFATAGKGLLVGGLPGAAVAGGIDLLGDWLGDRKAKAAEREKDKKEDGTGLGFSDVNQVASGGGGGTNAGLNVAGISSSNYSPSGSGGGIGAGLGGTTSGGQDYWGSGPGLDWGDVKQAWGAITGGGGSGGSNVKSGYDEGSVV